MLTISTPSHCISLYFWGPFMPPFPYLCLSQVAALWLPPCRAHDELFALQSRAQPSVTYLQSCFLSDVSKGESLLFSSSLSSFPSLQMHIFVLSFIAFLGSAHQHKVSYRSRQPLSIALLGKSREPLALPLLPIWPQPPLRRLGATCLFNPLVCSNSTTFWPPARCCDFASGAQRCLCRALRVSQNKTLPVSAVFISSEILLPREKRIPQDPDMRGHPLI